MKITRLLCILTALFLSSCTSKQPNIDYDTALSQVRDSYFARDYEEGFILGKNYISVFTDSLELKAWYLLNWNMNHYWNHDKIIPVAEEMIEIDNSNPWGYFALTGIYIEKVGEKKAQQAKELSEKLLALSPQNHFMQWMRLKTLNHAGDYDTVIEYINNNKQTKYTEEFQVLKGQAFKGQGLTPFVGEIRDEEKWNRALQIFDEALISNPNCVNAVMEKMPSVRATPDDSTILQKALKISPYSNRIRSSYWRAILGNNQISDSQKTEAIEQDIEQFLQKRANYPSALLTVLRIYLGSKLDNSEKKKYYSDQILEKFPHSYEAEWVLIHDMRAFQREYGEQFESNHELRKEWRKKLWSYTKRPQHHMENLLGEVYMDLFQSIKSDSTIDTNELSFVCMQTIKYAFGGTFQKAKIRSDVALFLSERIPKQKNAEKIATESIEAMKESLLSMKPGDISDIEWLENNNPALAPLHDALGWIQLNNDKLDEGEKNLFLANKMYGDVKGRNIARNLHHIGQLYERKNEFKKAESFYIQGIRIQTPTENPNEQALQSLYPRIYGNSDDFDIYLSGIKEVDSNKRKDEILASRIKEPQQAENFQLKNTHNEEVSLAKLQSKVVVINFWYIGCYWCEKEFPEFQKLYNDYKGAIFKCCGLHN